jgi:hypothetical protein
VMHPYLMLSSLVKFSLLLTSHRFL